MVEKQVIGIVGILAVIAIVGMVMMISAVGLTGKITDPTVLRAEKFSSLPSWQQSIITRDYDARNQIYVPEEEKIVDTIYQPPQQ